MKCNSTLAAAVLAIAALTAVCVPALAQITGPGRKEFVDSSRQSCSEGMHKANPKLPANATDTYCSCMAEAEADMTTQADVEYMAAHNAATEDYRKRVLALAPACKTKAGLK
jgi:hypothetical protein